MSWRNKGRMKNRMMGNRPKLLIEESDDDFILFIISDLFVVECTYNNLFVDEC